MIKTITVEEHIRLQKIAALAAVVHVETGYLLTLAIAVEQHMETQTNESAKDIEQAYYECSARTKRRYLLERELEQLLVQNNNLRLIDKPMEVQQPDEVDSEPSAIPANVISMFKPRVDK